MVNPAVAEAEKIVAAEERRIIARAVITTAVWITLVSGIRILTHHVANHTKP